MRRYLFLLLIIISSLITCHKELPTTPGEPYDTIEQYYSLYKGYDRFDLIEIGFFGVDGKSYLDEYLSMFEEISTEAFFEENNRFSHLFNSSFFQTRSITILKPANADRLCEKCRFVSSSRRD